MKVLLLSLIATVNLWAVSATVKYMDVNVTVNGVEINGTNRGNSFQFKENEEICLTSSGEGIVKITVTPNYTMQLEQSHRCTTILAREVQEKSSFVLFKKVNESSKDGVGSKSSSDEIYIKDILLSDLKGKEYLDISNERWATPLILTVIHEDEEVYSAKVEGDDVTQFLIPVSKLKRGMNIKIDNSNLNTKTMNSMIK